MNVSHTVLEKTVEEMRRLHVETTSVLRNESITRDRIGKAEVALGEVGALLSRGFWGRLRWLFRGK